MFAAQLWRTAARSWGLFPVLGPCSEGAAQAPSAADGDFAQRLCLLGIFVMQCVPLAWSTEHRLVAHWPAHSLQVGFARDDKKEPQDGMNCSDGVQ